jgi:hypothetical protein
VELFLVCESSAAAAAGLLAQVTGRPCRGPTPSSPQHPCALPPAVAAAAGHSDSVLGGAICASARLLATFAFDDSLFLWCLDSGRRLAAVKLPDTAQVGWMVAGSFLGGGEKTGVGASCAAAAVHRHFRPVRLPGIEPCFCWLLSARAEAHTCKPSVKPPPPPPCPAQHVALSPDGRRVAVALANASLCVFDAGSGDAGRPWEVRCAADPHAGAGFSVGAALAHARAL